MLFLISFLSCLKYIQLNLNYPILYFLRITLQFLNSNQFKTIKVMQPHPEPTFDHKLPSNIQSCFTDRPSPNIRYLISRQLPKLIDIAISQALEFVNTAQTKGKSLKQLKYTVLIAEQSVKPYLQKIIKALVRIWQLEIDNVQKTIGQIMAIVGYYIPSSYYLPLMISILSEQEIKNSQKNTVILLKLIAHMLLTSEDLQPHLQQLARIITTYQNLLLESDQGLMTVGQIAITLTNRLQTMNKQELIAAIFSVLLNIEATKSIPVQFRDKAKQAMSILAKKSGYSSVPELHSTYIRPVLSRIITNKQYTQWHKSSKSRFKFDTIVRNCESQCIRYLNQILTVIQYCISLECDIEIRMDTLVLLEQMMENSKIRQALKQHAQRVYLKVLNIAVKWKVGKPQIKIRKAGVINMIKMIEMEVINQEQLLDCFTEILPQIKTCIGDDWAPELRFSCCQFLQKFLMATREKIDGDQLKDIYVILLERLDDSQDPIRQKAASAISLFFMSKSLRLTPSMSSTIQYMINAIFIHFDDNNEQIRDAINVCLRHAARVDPNQVLKSAKANLTKMKHKNQCQELVQFCNDVIQEKKL